MNLDERYFELWNSSKQDLCNHSLKLEQELAKLREENEKLKSLVDDFILDCERCDRYFQSSSSRNQFQRRLMNKKKEVLGE